MALADGTPGCDGVLVVGEYDPRFDIETDEFEPFGFIYLITNKINGKQYVGQTIKTIAERWREHVAKANTYRANNETKRIIHAADMAIAKYGEENFTVEEIECCLIAVIDVREIYWIQEYDCCILDGREKGYNISRGGKGFKRYLLDEKKIAEHYETGESLETIAKSLGISRSTVRQVLIKNGIGLRSLEEACENNRLSHGQTVNRLDDEGNILETYPSQAHARQWVMENKLTEASFQAIRMNIRMAFILGRRAYGYYWEIEDLGNNDIETLRERAKAIQSNSHSNVKKKCCNYEGCNEKILEQSTYCKKHAAIVQGQSRTQCPDDITEVIRRVCETSFESTGRFYGVSGSAVKKWLKAHGLPFHIEELILYAVQQGLINDPLERYPHKEIYKRFSQHGGLKATAEKFHCSPNTVIKCCKRHGMTDEEVEKIISVGKNKNKPKKVAQCDDKGNIIQIFDTIHEAARTTNEPRIHITEECKGKRKTKWNWKFINQ